MSGGGGWGRLRVHFRPMPDFPTTMRLSFYAGGATGALTAQTAGPRSVLQSQASDVHLARAERTTPI